MQTSEQASLQRLAKAMTNEVQHLTDRILAELDFAKRLRDLHPEKSARWERLLTDARKLLCDAMRRTVKKPGLRSLPAMAKAVAQAEESLQPIAKAAKRYTVHCVGHAHIDMNWLWPWPDTVALANDTFLTVLKLMDEFSDFYFTQSQASVYALIQRHNPELFEQIRRRVKEGRWEVAAVQWVEGDKNMPQGEALARHLLYTRRFMSENLSLAPEQVALDWEPDTFGHAASIPGIVARGAVRWYFLGRGGVPVPPPIFWWQGLDGTRILAVRNTAECYPFMIGTHLAPLLLDFAKASGFRDWMYPYGIGDHGGGPTRRDIRRIQEMDSWPVFPRFRMTTAGRYFQLLEASGHPWPTVQGELNCEFTGCYSSHSALKRANRQSENLLLEAEVASTLSWAALGRVVPQQELREAWHRTLFNHFHDILDGAGIAATREYSLGMAQEVAATAQMVRINSLRALAGHVDTRFAGEGLETPHPMDESMAMGAGAGRMRADASQAAHVTDGPRPFVLFNPVGWERQELVHVTVWDTDTGASAGDVNTKAFVVRDSQGKIVPAQKIATGNFWAHTYVDLAFPASVEAMGYNTYIAEEGEAEPLQPVQGSEHPPRHEPYAPRATAMENEFLYVQFDEVTGGIVKLIDKTTGLDVADPSRPMALPEYVIERPRGMSAWTPGSPQGPGRPLLFKSLAREQNGPWVISLVGRCEVDDSKVTVTYALKAGQPWLDITIAIDWQQKGSAETGTPALRMVFPTNLREPSLRCEIPFGSLVRELNQGQEVPAIRWVDLLGTTSKGRQAGCGLLNDCKYGHALNGSCLSITLIRSSYDPDKLPEIGESSVRLALVPHGQAMAPAQMLRLAAAFNHPLQAIPTDVHPGRLSPASGAIVKVSPANVVLTGLKKAEDSDAVIFRFIETAGKDAVAHVDLDASMFGQPAEVVEVDLLERPVASPSARKRTGGFDVSVPSNGIASVRLAASTSA